MYKRQVPMMGAVPTLHWIFSDRTGESMVVESDEMCIRDRLEAVLSLPAQYRDVVYLHYYEGYTAPEIGEILEKNENTIYTSLTRARGLLKEKLGGDDDA